MNGRLDRHCGTTPVSRTAPVTRDVLSGWTRGGVGGELQPHVSRLVQSIVPVGDRSLAITLRRQRADAPLVLAHTDLAIARPVPGSRWPLGTRSARTHRTATRRRAGLSVITLNRTTSHPSVLVAPDRDQRDLLDEGWTCCSRGSHARLPPRCRSSSRCRWRGSEPRAPLTGRTRVTRCQRTCGQALADDAVRGEAGR
jgi:hypothetical protein